MTLAGARMLVIGASAGLGREIGLQAVHAGASVTFAARRKDKLDEAVEAAGGGHAVQLDVTDADSVTRGVADAVSALGGPIDLLVYASGWANMATLADETPDNWRRMFDINVVGAATTAQAALAHLAPSSVLVFLSSTSTVRRLWGMNAYGATKAAFDRLIAGLKDEHPKQRITRLMVGSVIGTEFGDGFDGAVLSEALTRWVASGRHTAGLMSVSDFGAVTTGVLALLRAFPLVEIPDLHLDPIGGLLTVPATPDVVAAAYSQL